MPLVLRAQQKHMQIVLWAQQTTKFKQNIMIFTFLSDLLGILGSPHYVHNFWTYM